MFISLMESSFARTKAIRTAGVVRNLISITFNYISELSNKTNLITNEHGVYSLAA